MTKEIKKVKERIEDIDIQLKKYSGFGCAQMGIPYNANFIRELELEHGELNLKLNNLEKEKEDNENKYFLELFKEIGNGISASEREGYKASSDEIFADVVYGKTKACINLLKKEEIL